jgi:hypothetical protein
MPTQSFLSGVKKDNKNYSKLLAQDSFNSHVSVVTALTPTSGMSDAEDSPLAGRSRVGSSTARTGRLGLLKSMSWQSIQNEQEQAALEVAAKARDENLGNNQEVIDAENAFLQVLFAEQNIRKKQTIVMRTDAPFTWSRGHGITHRGDNITTTHTDGDSGGGGGGIEHAVMPAEPLLPDLYSPLMLGQSVDVARSLPTRRPEPTLRPHLPQIRSALTPQP